MSKSHAAGYEHAEHLVSHGEVDLGVEVDVDEMLGGTCSMPEEDYLTIERAGDTPNAREYWGGYNAYMRES